MPSPAIDPAADAPLPHILVVEDDEDTRALTGVMLRGAFQVTCVSDAATALSIAADEGFCAFVLDINLGADLSGPLFDTGDANMSGIELLHRLRGLPRHQETPAIAVTAYAMPGDREAFLQTGFDLYLSKPFTKRQMQGALREALTALTAMPTA